MQTGIHALTSLLPVNRVRLCYISSIFFFIFDWDFDNRHYFYDKGGCIGFFKSSLSARLYLEVLVTIPWLSLKTVCINSLLCYISFCFLFSAVFCFLIAKSDSVTSRIPLVLAYTECWYFEKVQFIWAFDVRFYPEYWVH